MKTPPKAAVRVREPFRKSEQVDVATFVAALRRLGASPGVAFALELQELCGRGATLHIVQVDEGWEPSPTFDSGEIRTALFVKMPREFLSPAEERRLFDEVMGPLGFELTFRDTQEIIYGEWSGMLDDAPSRRNPARATRGRPRRR